MAVLRFSIIILWLAVSICAFYRLAQADAVITVTTTADALADDADCSLREAVIAANTDAPFGGCPAGNGADTILFDPALPKPATFVLAHTGLGEDAAQSGDLDILDGLTISGNSDDTIEITIDGNETDRVFHIHRGVQMFLENVTIRRGNPGIGVNGGGILTELTARLTITNSQFISNSALSGGAIYGVGRVTLNNSLVESNAGGGLTNDGGLLTLNDVTVRNNSGGYGVRNQEIGALVFNGGLVENNQGGGIYNGRSTANVNHVKIIGNGGSGVSSSGEVLTRLTISHSQILSNTAASGAGVSSQGVGARATIMNTQISGNTATNAGGGIFNNGIMEISGSTLDHNGAASGGGIHHFGGTLALTNSTLSQNSASDNGGGLYNGASATVKSSTIYANTAEGSGKTIFVDESELTLGNTIVARTGMGANCANSNGFINSAGYNLESSGSCGLNATGDQANADPELDVLADNGGPTLTHALFSDSPALDQGTGMNCPAADQRGMPRPQEAQCDIGAYEAGDHADLSLAMSASVTTTNAGKPIAYELVLTNMGPNSAAPVTLTNHLPANVSLIFTTVTATLTAGEASAISTTLVSGGDCDPNGCVRWTLPDMAAGDSLTATFGITAPNAAGVLTNTARVASNTSDLNTDNHERTALVTVAQSGADTTAPGPVGNLIASNLTASGVTLNWAPATDDVGVTGYHIWLQKNGPNETPAQIGATAALSYTVDALEPGTSYRLWVAAFDAAGNEAALAELTPAYVTTLAVLGVIRIVIEPPAPTISDAVSITVASIHRDSCLPQYDSHQVVEHEISILSVPSGELFCTPAEIPWDYSINVGALAAGPYTVTHTLEQQQKRAYFEVSAPPMATPTPTVDPKPTLPAEPTPTPTETPTPSAPQIVDPQVQTPKEVTVGQLFQYTLQANGFPPPTFTLVSGPNGMTVSTPSALAANRDARSSGSTATGLVEWTPTDTEVGVVAVTVRASNSLGSNDFSFTINVRAARTGNQSGLRSYLPIVQK